MSLIVYGGVWYLWVVEWGEKLLFLNNQVGMELMWGGGGDTFDVYLMRLSDYQVNVTIRG